MENWTYPDTTGWLEFNFNSCGYEFISKVNPNSSIGVRVKSMPIAIFNKMNSDCVLQLIGEGLTRNEIITKLMEINQYAHEAVIELA